MKKFQIEVCILLIALTVTGCTQNNNLLQTSPKASTSSEAQKPNENTHTPIKVSTPTSTPQKPIAEENLNDLKKNGLNILEDQSFSTELENWGKAKFITGEYRIDGTYKLRFYLVDDSGKILYKFPEFYGNQWSTVNEVKAISFKDVDKDGLKDIIIIADYMTGVGDNGAIPFHVASVYFQRDKEFINNPQLDKKLNDAKSNDTIDTVLKAAVSLLSKAPISQGNTKQEVGLFDPIINAYADLERSGYTSYDKNLIGDSLLAIDKGSTYVFGWDAKPKLQYAYYDINNDGLPELLIGANETISGIYDLQNGKPVSIEQVVSRNFISLSKDIDGNIVIEDSTGHMGYATEFFYKMDKNGKLVTLDKLLTNGDNKKDGEFIGYFRAKEVQGKEVDITDEEYSSLLRKYGSKGYAPDKEINIGKERMVNITWKPIAT